MIVKYRDEEWGGGRLLTQIYLLFLAHIFVLLHHPASPPPENIRNSCSRLCLTLYLPDILKLDTFLGAFASREEKAQSRICTHSQGRGR